MARKATAEIKNILNRSSEKNYGIIRWIMYGTSKQRVTFEAEMKMQL
jgi:hypothetical protein